MELPWPSASNRQTGGPYDLHLPSQQNPSWLGQQNCKKENFRSHYITSYLNFVKKIGIFHLKSGLYCLLGFSRKISSTEHTTEVIGSPEVTKSSY